MNQVRPKKIEKENDLEYALLVGPVTHIVKYIFCYHHTEEEKALH